MSLRRLFQKNRKADADRSSLRLLSDRTPATTSNVTTAPTHSLPGSDSVRRPDESASSLTGPLGLLETSQLEVTTPNYIYYRIYAEDGAIPSTTPVFPDNPFLGRIKIRSVPSPRTAKTVKCSIAKVENIKDRENTSLYLTPYSESPMDDAEKVTILNGTGPGSTPQEPLALVAKMSDSERRDLESERRDGLSSATPTEIRYVYYLLYADDYEIPSKVAFNPDEPSLGRIRVDYFAPPYSPTSIKQCISRVEGKPVLVNSDLFADTASDTPLKEGQISIFHTDGPGLSPNEPMAIVQVKTPPISDGRYLIKNRAADIYWDAWNKLNPIYFFPTTTEQAKTKDYKQWDITHDAHGNIFMKSPYVPSSWVGDEITGSTVSVPWRLIPADSKSYYLTTDIFRVSQNPRVPTMKRIDHVGPGSMATLKECDQLQMWEFIRI